MSRPQTQALHVAQQIGEMAKQSHFDWQDVSQVSYKVEEEWQELKEEILPSPKNYGPKAQEELGDLLFSVAQLARHLGFSSEQCLAQANEKFLKRFRYMTEALGQEGKSLEGLPQSEIDAHWARAKDHS